MSNSLIKSVARPIQYVQLDYIRFHRLLVNREIIKHTKLKMPIAASSLCLNGAEDVAIALFRRFLTTLFAKPKFITEKCRGVLEYKVIIDDVQQILRFREGLKCGRPQTADACRAVITVDDPEAGFLDLDRFLGSGFFLVGIDKKADSMRYHRRRWRRKAGAMSEACFYESAKAVLSWKSRLDAALLALSKPDAFDPVKDSKKEKSAKSTDQIQFEQALQNFSRRSRA